MPGRSTLPRVRHFAGERQRHGPAARCGRTGRLRKIPRGLILTDRGRVIARDIVQRHEVLTRLLSRFGLDEETIYRDVEGMEHHISRPTLRVLTLLTEELETNPELVARPSGGWITREEPKLSVAPAGVGLPAGCVSWKRVGGGWMGGAPRKAFRKPEPSGTTGHRRAGGMPRVSSRWRRRRLPPGPETRPERREILRN